MFKAMKKVFGILLGLVAFALVSCAPETENSSPDVGKAPAPILNRTSIELSLTESFTLIVENYDGEIEWSVSDYRVLEVEGGVVTCVGVGSAIVTAQAGETVLTCFVTSAINYIAVPYLVLEGEILNGESYALNLILNDSYELTPVLYTAGEKVENISFNVIADDSAVEIEGLILKAVSVTSETLVFVTCEYEGKSYTLTCVVTVSEV